MFHISELKVVRSLVPGGVSVSVCLSVGVSVGVSVCVSVSVCLSVFGCPCVSVLGCFCHLGTYNGQVLLIRVSVGSCLFALYFE